MLKLIRMTIKLSKNFQAKNSFPISTARKYVIKIIMTGQPDTSLDGNVRMVMRCAE